MVMVIVIETELSLEKCHQWYKYVCLGLKAYVVYGWNVYVCVTLKTRDVCTRLTMHE